VTSVSTSAGPTDYDPYYYQNCCGRPYARNEAWLHFFGGIADHIVRDIGPKTVLDAGCAFGFLVEILHDRGVDAYGIDISEYAIQQIREDMGPYCRVGSVLEPLPRTYDLIVCIEVLEHLSPQECDQAIGHFCQATDDILFSSTPDDYYEATHVNVRPPEYWAGLFARHGFYRDVEFDASFITAWAMRFRRATETALQPAYRLVETYERRLWQLSRECAGAHRFAADTRNQLAEAQVRLNAAQAELAQARAGQLLLADNQRLSAALAAEQEVRQQRDRQLHDVQLSSGWRFVTWVGKMRKRVCPPGSRRERWWLSAVNRVAGWLK
jgi:SAM-dependent methyltransferase